MDRKEKLLKILEAHQIITADRAESIKKELPKSKLDLDTFLINQKIVDEEKLAEVEAEMYNLPYYNLIDQEVPKKVMNFIPEDIAKTYHLICFSREDKIIKIGLISPNLKAMEAVNFLANDEKLQVKYYLISKASWQKVFKQYQQMAEEVSSALEIKAKEEGGDLITVDNEENEDLNNEEINSAPIARIVSVIIRHAVEARASDIHIEPFDQESRVRYRIDGILHTSLTLPKSIHRAIIARIKVLAKLKLDETRIPQDGRIRLMINNKEVDFRVSTLPLASSEKVVMRILDVSKGAPDLVGLGFNSLALRRIKDGIAKTSGIFLVTGPTGSGKTTTLYALLNILNKEGVNISTLEDPIEYQVKGINQSQVRPKIGFSFANGLRSLLRQDPNIIMVGEIRDEETAELAINAALTGHLVLSTLHTNDALGAIFRLLDMKIERFLLSSTLKTVVAQRLARQLCDKCKKEVNLNSEQIQEMKEELQGVPEHILKEELPALKDKDLDTFLKEVKVYEATGCHHCSDTGYLGRVAIAETVEINDKLQSAIESNVDNIDIEEVKKVEEFMSIKQDGLIKVLQGKTTQAEILRVIDS